MKYVSRGLSAALILSAVAAAPALAAPVTVNLRIEGKTSTLYEGSITTDARTISAPANDPGAPPSDHPCNYKDNGSNGGFGPIQGGPTTAALDAMNATGQTFRALWFDSSDDFQITQLGPDVAVDAPSFDYWGYAVNYTTAPVGGCQFILSAGSEVVWAYDYFDKAHLLKLSGPTAVNAGEPATYTVTDGQSGEPIADAAVGSGKTDAQGRVTLTFADAGEQRLKADRADSVRSNAVVVDVRPRGSTGGGETAGGGTTGGERDRTPPFARIRAPLDGKTYRRGRGPRVLRAEVDESGSGVLAVKARLTRRVGRKCWYFSGTRERFVRTRCGRGAYFTVTRQASFDYLLPGALRRGRYVFDVNAIDRAYNRDDERRRGSNRAVFRVR